MHDDVLALAARERADGRHRPPQSLARSPGVRAIDVARVEAVRAVVAVLPAGG